MTTKPKKTRNRPTKHASPAVAYESRSKGRRYKKKLPPIASRPNGIKQIPAPDLSLKQWPSDCVQIVAATPATVNVRGIREKITDQKCADCGQRLAVDSYSIREAWEMPQRQGRPLKFICVNCCLKYDRKSIEFLVDHRQTKGTNEGNELDE